MQHTYATLTNKNRDDKTMATLPILAMGLMMAGISFHTLAAASYTVTDLGTVAGSGIIATTISPVGMVLGLTATPVSINFSAVYLPQSYNPTTGSVNDISTTLTGDTFLDAVDMNSTGQVVGHIGAAYTGITNLPVVLRNSDGTLTDLGAVTNAYSTTATALSDNGQVVGYSSPTVNGCTEAFIASAASGFQALGSLDGSIGSSKALAINKKAQVVGSSSSNAATQGCNGLGTSYHAFVTTNTGLKDLHAVGVMPDFPGTGSVANAINDNGQAVGSYAYAMGATGHLTPLPIMHAVVWDTAAGTYTDFGTGTTNSVFRAINASGQVVGLESTYAVIANASGGALTNLNTLVTGMPTGWTLTSANSISDAGLILATAKDAVGLNHDVLLTPSVSLTNVPAAPTNLVSTSTSSVQIVPSWKDNATNETAQYLERCQGINCNSFTQIATLLANVTSYADNALAPATAYSYRVRAHSAAGDSAYSNIDQTTTLSAAVSLPAAPTGLITTATTRNQVVLAWTDNANNEQNYLVERCKTASCKFSKIATLGMNVTSYSNTGLTANTSYSYRVRASNTKGKSAYSNTVVVTTLP